VTEKRDLLPLLLLALLVIRGEARLAKPEERARPRERVEAGEKVERAVERAKPAKPEHREERRVEERGEVRIIPIAAIPVPIPTPAIHEKLEKAREIVGVRRVEEEEDVARVGLEYLPPEERAAVESFLRERDVFVKGPKDARRLQEIYKKYAEALADAVDEVKKEGGGSIIDKVIKKVGEFVGRIGGAIRGAISAIGSAIRGTIGAIAGALKGIASKIGEWIGGILKAIGLR